MVKDTSERHAKELGKWAEGSGNARCHWQTDTPMKLFLLTFRRSHILKKEKTQIHYVLLCTYLAIPL